MARTPVPVNGHAPVQIQDVASELVESRRPRFVPDDLLDSPEEILDFDGIDLSDDEDPIDAKLAEAGYDDQQDTAPWSPVPTAVGKRFVQKHPEAQIEIVFPTVYEEDRTAKLTDLITSQGVDVISHERMSGQVAKELGFEQYEYKEEQEQIAREKKKVNPTAVGIADDIASSTTGLDIGQGGIAPKPDSPFGGDDKTKAQIGAPVRAEIAPPEQKRADLSGDSTRQFRRDERRLTRAESEAFSALDKKIDKNVEALREEMREFVNRLGNLVEAISTRMPEVHVTMPEARAPDVRVEGSNIHMPEIKLPQPAPPPNVEVNVQERAQPSVEVHSPAVEVYPPNIHVPPTPSPARIVKNIERDNRGLITRVVEVTEPPSSAE